MNTKMNLGYLLLCGLGFLAIGAQAKQVRCKQENVIKEAIKSGNENKFKTLVTKQNKDCFIKKCYWFSNFCDKKPVLVMAIQNKKEDFVKYLVTELGADVNAPETRDGEVISYPLYDAIDSRLSNDILELLVENKAELDARNNYKESALFRSLALGLDSEGLEKCKEQVKFLLEKGADVNIKDNRGDTPLEWVVDGAVDYENELEYPDMTMPDKMREDYKKINNDMLQAHLEVAKILLGHDDVEKSKACAAAANTKRTKETLGC